MEIWYIIVITALLSLLGDSVWHWCFHSASDLHMWGWKSDRSFCDVFFFSKNEKRRNRAQNLQESMRIHAYSNIEWKLLFFLFPWSDLLMRVEIFMVGVENKLHKRMIRYTLFWTQWFARSFWLEPLRFHPEVSGCGQKSTLQEHYDAGHCTLVTVAPLKPSEFMSSDFYSVAIGLSTACWYWQFTTTPRNSSNNLYRSFSRSFKRVYEKLPRTTQKDRDDLIRHYETRAMKQEHHTGFEHRLYGLLFQVAFCNT